MSGAPELRAAALSRAESMRDVRVAEVLRRAIVDVHERLRDAWESSDGTVRAIDVLLRVDGHALGLCETYPAVRDGVVAAIASEAPQVVGASVVDLTTTWDLRERTVERGYRDASFETVDRDDGDDVRRALVGFLVAAGDEPTARALAAAELDVGAREIDVRSAPGITARQLEAPLSTLFGRPMRVQLR